MQVAAKKPLALTLVTLLSSGSPLIPGFTRMKPLAGKVSPSETPISTSTWSLVNAPAMMVTVFYLAGWRWHHLPEDSPVISVGSVASTTAFSNRRANEQFATTCPNQSFTTFAVHKAEPI